MIEACDVLVRLVLGFLVAGIVWGAGGMILGFIYGTHSRPFHPSDAAFYPALVLTIVSVLVGIATAIWSSLT